MLKRTKINDYFFPVKKTKVCDEFLTPDIIIDENKSGHDIEINDDDANEENVSTDVKTTNDVNNNDVNHKSNSNNNFNNMKKLKEIQIKFRNYKRTREAVIRKENENILKKSNLLFDKKPKAAVTLNHALERNVYQNKSNQSIKTYF